MKIKILDEIFEIKNEQFKFNFLYSEIETATRKNSELFFSHLVINQTEVYDNFEEFIQLNIKEVETIEVILKSAKEFSLELIVSMSEYLQNATPEINQLVDEFYKGPTKDTWDNLGQFIQGLNWVSESIVAIDKSSFKPNHWNRYLSLFDSLKDSYSDLEDSIKNMDSVSIADLIGYEILPTLGELLREVNISITEEGERNA